MRYFMYLAPWMPLIAFVIFVCAAALLAGPGESKSNPGENFSLDNHRMYGNYQVKYYDGKWSQPFFRETAWFYAKHFGGQVYRLRRTGRKPVSPEYPNPDVNANTVIT